jgi:hypothetical protein
MITCGIWYIEIKLNPKFRVNKMTHQKNPLLDMLGISDMD